MRRIATLLLLVAGCQVPAQTSAPLPPGPGDEVNAAVKEAVASEVASLVEAYKWFHQNAELSLKEEKTAAKFAAEVRAAGWTVTEKIGGTGVVGVLKNGEGPILLARIDMDGLPVKEETGLPYASTSNAMHACGHDTHLTMGVGLARVLAKLRNRWSGTMILVGQPAEEVGKGAMMMLADPNFHKALPGKPIACLSVHDYTSPAGKVGVCPGYATANVDSIDILIHGRGGHGAWPHQTVDPIVIGAEIVGALQTIVARKIAPGTRAVVTVGSFHSGTKHNIIPDEAKLQLTVRSYEDSARETLLSEIKQLTIKIAEAHRAPRPPSITYGEDFTPAGYHDPELTTRIHGVFDRLLGKENVTLVEPMMGGEDFSRFPKHWGVPGLQFRVGAARPNHDPSIGLHSSKWAADPEPMVRTGTVAFARACLELLGKK